jgi:hypothetical protein
VHPMGQAPSGPLAPWCPTVASLALKVVINVKIPADSPASGGMLAARVRGRAPTSRWLAITSSSCRSVSDVWGTPCGLINGPTSPQPFTATGADLHLGARPDERSDVRGLLGRGPQGATPGEVLPWVRRLACRWLSGGGQVQQVVNSAAQRPFADVVMSVSTRSMRCRESA